MESQTLYLEGLRAWSSEGSLWAAGKPASLGPVLEWVSVYAWVLDLGGLGISSGIN